jgi:hypothetical protein
MRPLRSRLKSWDSVTSSTPTIGSSGASTQLQASPWLALTLT